MEINKFHHSIRRGLSGSFAAKVSAPDSSISFDLKLHPCLSAKDLAEGERAAELEDVWKVVCWLLFSARRDKKLG